VTGWRKKQIRLKEELTMEMGFKDDGYNLNYGNIANAEWLCPTIRLTALDLQKCPYISVGDWFKKLNDNSLRELQQIAENTFDNPDAPDGEDLEQMMILAMMLASAEGTDDIGNMDHMKKQLSKIIMLITLVCLERKGLVRIWYENMTLGADMEGVPLVEKL
jgi:hypothetical protein